MMSFRSKPLPEGELEQAEISNIPLLFKATGINQTCQVSSSNKNFSDLSPVTIDIVAEPHPEMFEFKIKDDSPKVLQRGTTTSVNFIAEWTSVGNTAFNYIGHNSWAKTGAFPKYDTRPASVKI
jgi:hypothetical protein